MFKNLKEYYISYKQSEPDKKRLIEIVSVSLIILVILIIKISFNGFWIWGGDLAFAETGQFGDFVGGVIGTIFSAAGFYFLYITLNEQRKSSVKQEESFMRERLETRFFEMLKIHKENIQELNYTEKHRILDLNNNEIIEIKSRNEGRKVFKVIFHDFTLLAKELSWLFTDADEIYLKNYKNILQSNTIFNERNIDLLEIAKLDILYCIVFFGLSEEDRKVLYNIFSLRYNEEFTTKLIAFAALKPKKESKYYKLWKEFNQKDNNLKLATFRKFYQQIKDKDNEILNNRNQNNIFNKILKININYKKIEYAKYYGGHQFRLGHYFRHLFQSVNYINKAKDLPYSMKYENIKLLRAQISTFEQKLIFLNSISALGRSWELEKIGENSQEIHLDNQLITKYNLIKNIPDDVLFNKIKISSYYPLVLIETNYNPIDIVNRQNLEKKYN